MATASALIVPDFGLFAGSPFSPHCLPLNQTARHSPVSCGKAWESRFHILPTHSQDGRWQRSIYSYSCDFQNLSMISVLMVWALSSDYGWLSTNQSQDAIFVAWLSIPNHCPRLDFGELWSANQRYFWCSALDGKARLPKAAPTIRPPDGSWL